MAIRKKENREGTPINIDLSGPDGNAHVLLGMALRLCRQMGYDKDKTERILDEMQLSDYEGLLYTFDREFGLLVTLWR
tara:strand:- start:147 stop:380 length:234 start_codon:yes stop_codon:yes gene_type:complete